MTLLVISGNVNFATQHEPNVANLVVTISQSPVLMSRKIEKRDEGFNLAQRQTQDEAIQGFLLAVFTVTVFSCCSTQTGFTNKSTAHRDS